nr:hypothetical protein [Pseudoramibacter alactolyticus]
MGTEVPDLFLSQFLIHVHAFDDAGVFGGVFDAHTVGFHEGAVVF